MGYVSPSIFLNKVSLLKKKEKKKKKKKKKEKEEKKEKEKDYLCSREQKKRGWWGKEDVKKLEELSLYLDIPQRIGGEGEGRREKKGGKSF